MSVIGKCIFIFRNLTTTKIKPVTELLSKKFLTPDIHKCPY